MSRLSGEERTVREPSEGLMENGTEKLNLRPTCQDFPLPTSTKIHSYRQIFGHIEAAKERRITTSLRLTLPHPNNASINSTYLALLPADALIGSLGN